MTDTLAISPDVQLPLEAVTDTFAILAKRGAGKSNAAVVMAEEMWNHSLQWVAVDPKGDWWGVRASITGGEGLPIPVFGGAHGDLPLLPTDGAFMANLIVKQGITCILDVSDFDDDDQAEFLVDFAQALFRAAKAEPSPLHLFLEEAHEFIPQQPDSKMLQASVKAWSRIIRLGRTHGLGATLVTQRSADLNKKALSQIDTLFVMRTQDPRDRDAIGGWVKGTPEAQQILADLTELEAGQAWVWSPQFLKTVKRMTFRRRTTFDSGATPAPGQRRAVPTLADIDLGAIQEQMSTALQRAAEDDPEQLHRTIEDLHRQLAEVEAGGRVVEVKVPYIPDDVIAVVRELAGACTGVAGYRDLGQAIIDLASTGSRASKVLSAYKADEPVAAPIEPAAPPPAPVSRPVATPRAPRAPAGTINVRGDSANAKVLGILAQYPSGRSHGQLAMLTGYSPKASTIGVALSKLREAGYVEPPTGDKIARITEAGIDALGSHRVRLPTGTALRDYWVGKVGRAERVCLEQLLAQPRREFDVPSLADLTGYSPDASTIGVAMSKLRKLELAEGWHLHPTFAEAIR